MEENNSASVPMELCAQKARLQLTGERELLSSGMSGVVQVRFECSEDWDGLSRTAVFSNGTVSVDVPETQWEDGICTVPQQVLQCAGKTVLAGLYGTDGSRIMLPTIWCCLGRVEAGAAPSGRSALPPEAPVWASLSARIAALEAIPQSIGYEKPADGIPLMDLSGTLQQNILLGASAYRMPENGIPATDLAANVQSILGDVGWKYQKPPTGIPYSDLAEAVKAKLDTEIAEITEDEYGVFSSSMRSAEVYGMSQAGARLYAVGPEGVLLPLIYAEDSEYVKFGGAYFDNTAFAVKYVEYQLILTGVTRLERTLQSTDAADAGGYFTAATVVGQLQEIGAKLAQLPTDVWEGGSY